MMEEEKPRRILPIPPAPAFLDQRMVHIGSIRQNYIGNRAPVLVEAVSLECDLLPKGEGRSGVLRVLAVGLALLGTVEAAEADAFRMVVVKD
jgi:hypothetical protein